MPAPQRSIRIPDDLVEAIEAEAERLERSFSWVAVRAMRAGMVSFLSDGEMREAITQGLQRGASTNGLGKGYAAPRPKGAKR